MPPPLDIRQTNPASPVVRPLLTAHLAFTSTISSPEACHSLDLDALQMPDIQFFAAFDGNTAVGCGALKDLGNRQMEVKSVHVAQSARGRGIAKQLMLALHDFAIRSGTQHMLLETGSELLPAFDPARALYETLGYQYGTAFGDYRPHPQSAFMRLSLTE
ncbi:GNAT family N-acetyltransferase [Phaeobacter sp. B1627]|uniref:GNAT family N-acetyltransferase n=1 Tax=Phaeobacter sp. B1627 TaxID=2583809 RepID=UPI001119623F|nr:GNAT family N-acetyltransferase [Phaeobacter sp. B1627]TNJ39982.1 GNAT family N-acetyltransferase [Phaeobacter sp. B1627]